MPVHGGTDIPPQPLQFFFSMHDHHSWLQVYYFFNIYFCNVMSSRQVLNPGYFNGNVTHQSHFPIRFKQGETSAATITEPALAT